MNEYDELLKDFTTAFAYALSESVRAIGKRRSSNNFTAHAVAQDIREVAVSMPNDRPRVKDIMLQIANEMGKSKSSHRI